MTEHKTVYCAACDTELTVDADTVRVDCDECDATIRVLDE